MFSPTFVHHPEHGEIFFSSILNRHGSWLDEHAYFGTVPLNERPYHCTWADGSELSEDELARQVYATVNSALPEYQQAPPDQEPVAA